MSILTKIAVVVLVAVTLLFSPVFIRLATVVPNYRQLHEEQVLRGNMMEQSAHVYRLSRDVLANKTAEQARQLDELSRQQEADRTRLQAEISSLRNQLAQRASENSVLTAAVETQTTVNRSQREQIQSLEGSLRTAHGEINQRDRDNLEIKTALDGALQDRDRLTMVVRVLRESNDELKRELQSVMAGRTPATGATGTSVAATAADEVSGRIEAVDPTGVVSINIGSAHGLRRGARLTIARGNQFVGVLQIDEVDIGQSIGIIVSKRLEPRQGDQVFTSTN